MAITERDYVEIFVRHGISRKSAMQMYDAFCKDQSEGARVVRGMSDELAKKHLDLFAAAMARNKGILGHLRGLFGRLFGK